MSDICECGAHKWFVVAKKKVVMYSAEDDHILCCHKWRSRGRYAYAKINGKAILMHKFIMGGGGFVDHIDGNGMNNCRVNLRQVTHAQNMANRKKHKHSTMKFKGVERVHGASTFRAIIRASGVRIKGQSRRTEIEAAADYNDMAIKYFGEYARLNVLR